MKGWHASHSSVGSGHGGLPQGDDNGIHLSLRSQMGKNLGGVFQVEGKQKCRGSELAVVCVCVVGERVDLCQPCTRMLNLNACKMLFLLEGREDTTEIV